MADRLLRTLRCRNDHMPGVLGRLASSIGGAGANIGDIRTVWVGPDHIVRDLDILVDDEDVLEAAMAAVRPPVDGSSGTDKGGASMLSATAERRRLSAAT